jgi:GntR family transcriptional regulator, transcriptional repressor for pyruvate dehydrogenase complex
MTADWTPVPRARAYELVLQRIEEQILAGNLRVGDRLPGERQLAASLGVGRPAIREALRILEAQGLLVAHPGRGPDSGAVIAAAPEHGLGRLLRMNLALSHYRLDEVVDVRVMLEQWCVTEAAKHADPEHLADAERLLDLMDDPALSVEAFGALDSQYHAALALSSGNRLAGNMTAALRDSVRHLILEAFQKQSDWTATAHTLRRQHREIFRAVRDGRAVDAAQAIEAHIRGFHGKLADRAPEGG